MSIWRTRRTCLAAGQVGGRAALPVLNEVYSNDKIGNMTSKAGVTITAPATARYGFEAYNVYSTAGQCYCYAYAPNTGAWVFSGAAGVSENGTCLTSGNPPTPHMTRTAFLQTGDGGDADRSHGDPDLPPRRPPGEHLADDQRQRAEGERAAIQAVWRSALGKWRGDAD